MLLGFEHCYIPSCKKKSMAKHVRNREGPTWSGLCSNGQLSQWSPTPSWSVSLWSTLYTYGQLSFSFRMPEQLIILLAKVFVDFSIHPKCSVPYHYAYAKFDSYHHHRYQLHKHLLLHFCLCRSGLDCCYMGSYHSGRRLHLGLDHIALGWRQMGSCPVSDRNMFKSETFWARQCRQCNGKEMY